MPQQKKIPIRKEEEIAELLCELTRLCNIKEEHFASSFNLSPGEFRLLKYFASKETYTIKELCVLLNLTPGRITHLVSSLEKKKLIKRNVTPEDRRNILISLSSKTQNFINNIYSDHINFHNNVLISVSDKKKSEILSSLKMMVDSLQNWINTK